MSSLLQDARALSQCLRSHPHAFASHLLAETYGDDLSDRPYAYLTAKVIRRFTTGHNHRLTINAPPGSPTTWMGTSAHVAYRLGHHPTSVIEVACGDVTELEACVHETHSLLTTDSYGEIFRQTRLKARHSPREFHTTRGGCVRFNTLRDAQHGPPVDLMIFNTPQTERDVVSREGRDLSLGLYQNARERLSPKGSELTLTPRQHTDDLTGRLIARGDCGVLAFPLIAEHRTEFRVGDLGFKRRPGDVLDPRVWPLGRIEGLKQALTPETFAARYQQDPMSSPEGS